MAGVTNKENIVPKEAQEHTLVPLQDRFITIRLQRLPDALILLTPTYLCVSLPVRSVQTTTLPRLPYAITTSTSTRLCPHAHEVSADYYIT